MIMSPLLRKVMLAVHLAVSVGWIGAVFAYMVLDFKVVTTDDVATLRASYLAMDLIARSAIVPLATASLVTGLIMSLGTKWGLFQHYWTVISLVLTVVAIAVLLIETRTIEHYAMVAADPTTSDEEVRALANTLVHSVGGTFVLLVIMWLNVYKPRGVTRYGWRKQQEQLHASKS